MIYLEKSQPAPTCLAEESQKANGDYKCGDVLTRLIADFKNKCYICETPSPTTINIEHFRPHSKFTGLKYDWNNLFWACAHCNKIKSDNYTNLIDCTDTSSNIEARLKYHYIPIPKAIISVTSVDESIEAKETAELLNAVYKGTTPLSEIEANNICDLLLNEMLEFQKFLRDYFCDDNNTEDQEYLKRKIKSHLRDGAGFAAVKRSYIRSVPKLLEEFGEYF